MERHGYDSPPKVMWGVDDNIRELFEVVQSDVSRLPHEFIEDVSKNFEKFALEFEEMIFKEESILLMIYLRHSLKMIGCLLLEKVMHTVMP